VLRIIPIVGGEKEGAGGPKPPELPPLPKKKETCVLAPFSGRGNTARGKKERKKPFPRGETKKKKWSPTGVESRGGNGLLRKKKVGTSPASGRE